MNEDLFYQLFKDNEAMTPEEYRRRWAQWIKDQQEQNASYVPAFGLALFCQDDNFVQNRDFIINYFIQREMKQQTYIGLARI